ncbi:MAG: hypothetical protein WCG27_05985, partial [Pseudomonadota bacterium]
GYSKELCQMHSRHLLIQSKKNKSKNKENDLRPCGIKKSLLLKEIEKKRKDLIDAGIGGAVGATIGAGGGFAGSALLGSVLAAHAAVVGAPIILGVAIAGAGVGAIAKLAYSKKNKNKNVSKESEVLDIFHLKNV